MAASIHSGSTFRCASLGTLLKVMFALLVGVLFMTFSNDVAGVIQQPAALLADPHATQHAPFISAVRSEGTQPRFRIVTAPTISPHAASQLLQASMAVSLSSGEEGLLVSPFALDRLESGTPQHSWLYDEDARPRLIIVETAMVAAALDDGTMPSPLFQIRDAAVLSKALLSLEHSGTLRRNRAGDLLVFVVACNEGTQCNEALRLHRVGSSVGAQHQLLPLASCLDASREQRELFSAFSAFAFPFASTDIAQRSQQLLYRAAATVVSLEALPNHCGETDDTLVAVIDLDDVAVCSNVFRFFRVDAPLVQLIGFRNATESQSKLGCCWYAQAAAHALGEERIPVELIGQPVVSHRFVGGSTMAVMRSFLNSVHHQSFLRQRHGDSIAPLISLVAVKEYRSHVHMLNDVLLGESSQRSAAVVTDANASVCEGVARGGEVVASMCGSDTADHRPRWAMVVETKGCTQYPRFDTLAAADLPDASSRPLKNTLPAFPTCDGVVPGDAVLVDTQGNHTVNAHLSSLIRQRALHDLLVSASGHYGLKGTDTSELSRRGRDYAQRLESSEQSCMSRNGWQDAIIAYAAGYSDRQTIAPLLNTFTKYHAEHCTKLYLFVFQEHLSLYANEHPDIIPVAVDSYRGGRLLTVKCKLNKQRKEVIYKWLSERLFEQFIHVKTGNPRARPFRYILLVDSRDVFFQDDPFKQFEALDHELQKRPPDSAVHQQRQQPSTFMVFPPETSYFGELEWAFRGGFEFNAKWVEMAFGAPYLQHMLRSTLPLRRCIAVSDRCGGKAKRGSKTSCSSPCDAPLSQLHGGGGGGSALPLPPPLPIVCGGIYGGTSIAVLDFLKLLVNAMSSRPPKQDCNNDQGVMNGLVSGGFAIAGFPHDVLVTNPSSTAFTHRPRRGTVSWSADGHHLVNCRGERYAVVHQLDRFEGVWQAIQKQLSRNETLQQA